MYYDKKSNNITYKIGDIVLLTNEQIKPGKPRKLAKTYNGPYKILEINSPINYTILVNKKKIKVYANRLKPAFVSE